MKNLPTLIFRPLLIGAGGMLLIFFAMMGASPKATIITAAITFFILGAILGRLQPQSLWYAPLLVVAPLAIVFIPMGIGGVNLFLYPVATALGGAYAGMLAGAYWPDGKGQFRDFSNRYLLPFGLGFVGMALCLFSMFFGYMLKVEFPMQVIAYPVIFAAMGALLGMKNPHWLTTALMLCLLPFLYWVVIPLFNSGGPEYQIGRFDGGIVMIFVILTTFLLTALAGYGAARRQG
jgi:hypothetical protein